MAFDEQVLLAIIDKVFIGILLLIIGFWLNARLEQLKAQLELAKAVFPSRVAAYSKLWQLTEPFSPSRTEPLSQSMREKGREALTEWYYKQGNALYLSLDAVGLFFSARYLLESSDATDDQVTAEFSKLRTCLKVDLGVYSGKDARVHLPRRS